jgi:hypothetical protein
MAKFRLTVLSKNFCLTASSPVTDKEVNPNEHSVSPAAIEI